MTDAFPRNIAAAPRGGVGTRLGENQNIGKIMGTRVPTGELTDEEVSEFIREKPGSRREIESAFLDFGYGRCTEAELRIALLSMSAGLTDEEVSYLVHHIREDGGGV